MELDGVGRVQGKMSLRAMFWAALDARDTHSGSASGPVQFFIESRTRGLPLRGGEDRHLAAAAATVVVDHPRGGIQLQG